MKIGIPQEVKNHEYRVAITPAGVRELSRRGHSVYVQASAGRGSSITDDDFRSAGAEIIASADDVWSAADLILKVKEPVAEEYRRMQYGQVLFTYLHLAADPELTKQLMERCVTAIAYETVQTRDGALPLLAPMSEVAGRLAPQVGATCLMVPSGGSGVLPGGIPGVAPAKVVVIGGGVSGTHAATIALGLGADVTILDLNLNRLRQLDVQFGGRVRTIASSVYSIEREVLDADLVIGAVLVPGAKAPTLVSNELVSRMKPGSVLVDIAIDQGGCFEDSHATTHADPTFRVHDSLFYCVANMPGAVARTSTYGLTNATMRYAQAIADQGWADALRSDPALSLGLSTHGGALTNAAVGAAVGVDAVSLGAALG